MGLSSSKTCSTCDKRLYSRQTITDCNLCRKVVCTDCSNREPVEGQTKKIRVCHVCRINRENRLLDSLNEKIIVGRPQSVQRMISVRFDNDTGTYSGLPILWRQLLDMPLNASKDEINTSDWDQTIAPIKPPQKVMFKLKISSGENHFIISNPIKADHVFKVEYDKKKHQFKGLPKEFEEYLPAFTREEIREDPSAVLQSIQQTINRKDNATPAVIVEQ